YGEDAYTAAHLLASLDEFERLYKKTGPGPEMSRELKNRFVLYRSVGSDGKGRVLFTGYYEPELAGALAPDERFRWPVYGPPDDLIEADLGAFLPELEGSTIKGRLEGRRLVPYYSRQEIDRQSVLTGRGLELAWVDDPVGLFFLHIQGSGRLRLPDGRVVRIGYAGTNGRPYRSLGRHMIEQGLLNQAETSMQAIRTWLAAHPEQAPGLLDYNPSYVFFRMLEGEVVGNINVPLTPGRSAALDHKMFPKGALAWISGRKPTAQGGQVSKPAEFSRFVLVQDTGGAIKGPGRLDLFFGHGPEAELEAGHLKEPGQLFFLVLRPE
ncbi:MAG: MltA domain-containing protein, partial [Thermodesulfobacteriota bacterium]